VACETRTTANRRPRFATALRRKQQRGARTHEGAHDEPRAKKPNVLPVYRTAVRRSAWPLHGSVVIIYGRSAANVAARGGSFVRFCPGGVWAR